MKSKTNISNTIKYSGNISVKLQRNGNIYKLQSHNTGTKYLTDTIARALCGQNISLDIPRYIDFVAIEQLSDKSSTDEPQVISLLYYPINFTGITWGDVAYSNSKGTSIRLTATILPTDKLSLSGIDNYTLQLRIKSVNNEVLAKIEPDSGDTVLYDLYKSLIDGTSAIIEWYMHFDY